MISVIIPVYNVKSYLKKCVDSVINQTYKDLEIILVDDGSTDGSSEICDQYKTIDSRIKVIHKKNGGLSDARNCGIDISKGEYITFLDSDDWVDENIYKILYDALKKYDVNISICKLKQVCSEDEKLDVSKDNIIIYSSLELSKKLYYNNNTIIQIVGACNKLYKKNVFKNKRFPYGKFYEDGFLIPILLNEAKNVAYIDKELLYYRQREGSITHKKFSEKTLECIEVYEYLINYYKNNRLIELIDGPKKFLVENILMCYYLAKKSHLENKKDIMDNLLYKFESIDLKYNKPLKQNIKIHLFKISPVVYCFILELKNKFIKQKK